MFNNTDIRLKIQNTIKNKVINQHEDVLFLRFSARLDDSQAGIKIAGRNTNNLRYADDTTLMAESKEEKDGLKLNIQKTKITTSIIS